MVYSMGCALALCCLAAVDAGGAFCVFVDPARGDDRDANPGTSATTPLLSVHAAVASLRVSPTPDPRDRCVVLAMGRHTLNATLELGPRDSGLRFVAAAAGSTGLTTVPLTTTISGGTRVTGWSRRKVTASGTEVGVVTPCPT